MLTRTHGAGLVRKRKMRMGLMLPTDRITCQKKKQSTSDRRQSGLRKSRLCKFKTYSYCELLADKKLRLLKIKDIGPFDLCLRSSDGNVSNSAKNGPEIILTHIVVHSAHFYSSIISIRQ